jgi:hypothetical protein
MDPSTSQQAGVGVASLGLPFIVAVLGAIAGWGAFIIQHVQLRRERANDLQKWLDTFTNYRRQRLKPLAETIRKAYSKFAAHHQDAPTTWEDAMNRARFPQGLPITPLTRWSGKHRATLDPQDEFLMRLAEHIYPPFEPNDNRPIEDRSSLLSSDYRVFNEAHGGVADYFDHCGMMRQQSSQFADFLETRVRPNHYPYIKLITYLELAYAWALGEAQQRGPGKKHLFELGNAWRIDDPRK